VQKVGRAEQREHGRDHPRRVRIHDVAADEFSRDPLPDAVGQTNSSPIASLNPVPRGSSETSDGPASPV